MRGCALVCTVSRFCDEGVFTEPTPHVWDSPWEMGLNDFALLMPQGPKLWART